MKDKYDKKIELSKKSKIVLCVSLALIIAFSFASGLLLYKLILDSKRDSLIWAISYIDKYGYYYDEDSGTAKKYTASDYLKMITNDLDDYSDFFTAEEHLIDIETNKGNSYGLGLKFYTGLVDGKLLIRYVKSNSPAEKAGFKNNDFLIGIEQDGVLLKFTPDFLPSDFMKDKDETATYTYVVERQGETIKIDCARQVFVTNYVNYYDNEKKLTFTSQNKEPLQMTVVDEGMANLDSDTALIQLNLFQGNAVQGIKTAMEYLKERNKTKLILDLRNNGGGDMEILRKVSSYFVHKEGDKNPVIAVAKDKNGKELIYTAKGDNYNKNISKIIVLANENTASASECLIGAMLHYGTTNKENLVIEKHKNINGEMVATTFGKGIMQTTYTRLITGESIKLTTAVVYQPNGTTTIHNKGITTTSENGVEKGQALLRALEILG